MSDFVYFKPYEGDKPYIFVSYAHADNDKVLPVSERYAPPWLQHLVR